MKLKTINIIAAMLLSLGLAQFAYADTAALKEISMLSEQGNQAAALDKVNTYLTSNPKDAEALFMKGVILVELARRDEAIKAFTNLTEAYPNLPEPYNNLAVLYADKGAYDQARRALEKAIKTHPSYATAHENLGDIYARLASEAYNKAFKLDANNARAQNKLSMITNLFGSKGSVAPTVVAANEPAKPVAPAPAKPVAVAPVAPKPAVVEKPVAPKPVAPEPNPAMSQDTEILNAVNGWAKAWSAQDVNAYLSSYASNFTPSKGMSRSAWKKQRRQRVSAPKGISVKLSGQKVRMISDNEAKVSFYQSYKANGKPRGTGKTLTMTKENGQWLIKREKVGG